MAMLKVLKFLNDDEYQSLLRSAERAVFKAGQALIREGEENTNIYVIVSGEIKITRKHGDFEIELARHGAGQVYGDMSFIEGLPANVSVTAADSEVLALVIGHAYIDKLAAQDSGFAARFYRSLAEILSRRLRETTGLVDSAADPESVWGNP